VQPAFTFPARWKVCIPTVADQWCSEDIASAEDALGIADAHGLQLDVDDWTYALMAKHGAAPPIRPGRLYRPGGRYPGGDVESRQASLDVLQQAPDFLGLTDNAALALDRSNSPGSTRHASTARSGSSRCPTTSNPSSSRRQNTPRSGRTKVASTTSRSSR
jgi:hypothetical protein